MEYALTNKQAELFNQIISERKTLDRRESDLMIFFFESVGLDADEVDSAVIGQGKVTVKLKDKTKESQ